MMSNKQSIASMTAYANITHESSYGQLIIELRSVNHRYLDLQCKLPDVFRVFEPELRRLAQQQLNRGKVDIWLKFVPNDIWLAQQALVVNYSVAKQYIQAALELETLLGEKAKGLSTSELLQQPQILVSTKTDIQLLATDVITAMQTALSQLCTTRQHEGTQLANGIAKKIAIMQKNLKQLVPLVPELVKQYQAKLHAHIKQLMADSAVTNIIDNARIEQELVLFAQKIDVTEELDRLAIHLDSVLTTLERGGVLGRRLDFLMQELHREANTLGAKSVAIQSSQAAIDLKVLIDQVREQVQNIE